MEERWIAFNSLEEIKKVGLNAVLLIDKDGRRQLDTLVNNQRGNWRLMYHDAGSIKKMQALAYYRIDGWNFCNIPYGEPLPGFGERNGEAYALWGFQNDGAFPIEEHLVRILKGVPAFTQHHYGVSHPDILLGYHILPDIYSFMPEIK